MLIVSMDMYVYVYVIVYTVHVISQNTDDRATEADSGGSASVSLTVATTPLVSIYSLQDANI